MTGSETEPSARPSAADDWLTPGRFALLLGLLILAAFPGVLLGGRTFVIRDFGMFGYPLAYFHRQSFWRGELPLWNPDRKSTRLNSSHLGISYAVFCLKKNKK